MIRHWEALRFDKYGPLFPYLRYLAPHFLLRRFAMSGTLVSSTPGSPTLNSDAELFAVSFVRRTDVALQSLRA